MYAFWDMGTVACCADLTVALARSSFDHGQVHTVVLNNYIDWNQNTPQYNWCDLPHAPAHLSSMARSTQLTENLHLQGVLQS